MNTQTAKKISVDELVHLPSYAQFLLDNKVDEFAQYQINLAFELNIPLLNYFKNFSPKELNELVRSSSIELFTCLRDNKAQEFIETSLNRWRLNQLPVIDKNNVVAEDVTLGSYLRKKMLVHFIQAYTTDAKEMMELIDEIDLFIMESETQSYNLYINLLQERIEEHSHFIEKVNNTIPGALYVYDSADHKNIYSNDKLGEMLGYSAGEWNLFHVDSIDKLVHPQDRERLQHYMMSFSSADDGKVKSFKYRVKKKDGAYIWLTTHDSVFKRAEDGSVVQTIGIVLDTNAEETAVEELHKSDERFRQAEAITHMGNYAWYPRENKLEWSDELYRIYGLNKADGITQIAAQQAMHPDDRNFVHEQLEKAAEKNGHFDFHFRIHTKDEKEKILHARGEIFYDDTKSPLKIIGTAQDVTEKQLLIQQLKKSEALYRQAEELANMGTWNLDLKTNQIEWTDQLYKIYGMQPHSEEITKEKILSFVHPDDKAYVQDRINTLETEDHVDYTFRIIAKDGKLKWVRSIGHVHKNENGAPEFVIGSERDVTEKQTLISQLKESEQLYKQAQSLSHIGNWSFDLATQQFTWSDEMFEIYELPKSQLPSAEEWKLFVHPDDREEVVAYQEECIREAKTYDKVHRVLLPNGVTKILHRKGEFIVGQHGRPVKMIGTTQDVTEQFQVQQQLKENQKFIRKITDATPSIIASYSVNTGKYAFLSEGVTKLLGYSIDEIMAEGVPFLTKIIHPDDLPQVLARDRRMIAESNANKNNDVVTEFTYRMRHKKGHYRWFHTYSTIFDRTSEGKVDHVMNITIDVTEQTEAAEKIKEQEHFIQQIADASPTILYLFDVERQSMVYTNREVFFVLGYSPEEVMDEGDKITSVLYNQEDFSLLPERKESAKKFQRVDSMIQYECRMQHKDGSWRWLLVREIVFKTDDAGNVTQILGAALDITRRKEMEKTILQNTWQLEQSNASLEEFAYVASHDLKEPLRKISTFGDRLVATQADHMSSDGKIYLTKIVDASQRMQTMISDLLSISMISGNKSFEPYSLQTILEEVLQTLEYKIEQQNAVIRYDKLPEAKIVPAQFRQLFQNLLSNSLKFVREGVQPIITIECERIPESDAKKYGLSGAAEYYKIVIADNGIGFENEFAGKIFAIFQRLHGRSEYEGSGIGLAICKKIVEHHRGVIFAAGLPNEGASFTIILPA